MMSVHVSTILFTNEFEFEFLVFNATFRNISAISWRPVLVMEETGVPGENHRPWASNVYQRLNDDKSYK